MRTKIGTRTEKAYQKIGWPANATMPEEAAPRFVSDAEAEEWVKWCNLAERGTDDTTRFPKRLIDTRAALLEALTKARDYLRTRAADDDTMDLEDEISTLLSRIRKGE